jgi:hypothetical protein
MAATTTTEESPAALPIKNTDRFLDLLKGRSVRYQQDIMTPLSLLRGIVKVQRL